MHTAEGTQEGVGRLVFLDDLASQMTELLKTTLTALSPFSFLRGTLFPSPLTPHTQPTRTVQHFLPLSKDLWVPSLGEEKAHWGGPIRQAQVQHRVLRQCPKQRERGVLFNPQLFPPPTAPFPHTHPKS